MLATNATKPGDQRTIHRTHVVEGGNRLPLVALRPPHRSTPPINKKCKKYIKSKKISSA